MNRTVSTFLLTATLLLGGLCGAVSARPQAMAMASSVEVAQPAPVHSDLAMESEGDEHRTLAGGKRVFQTATHPSAALSGQLPGHQRRFCA